MTIRNSSYHLTILTGSFLGMIWLSHSSMLGNWSSNWFFMPLITDVFSWIQFETFSFSSNLWQQRERMKCAHSMGLMLKTVWQVVKHQRHLKTICLLKIFVFLNFKFKKKGQCIWWILIKVYKCSITENASKWGMAYAD